MVRRPRLALLSLLAGLLSAADGIHELAGPRRSLKVTPRAPPPKAASLSQTLASVEHGVAQPEFYDELYPPMKLLAELEHSGKRAAEKSQEPGLLFSDLHLDVKGPLGKGSYALVFEAGLGSTSRKCSLAVRVAISSYRDDLVAESKAVELFDQPPFITTYFHHMYSAKAREGGVGAPKYSTVTVMERIDESLQDLIDRTYGILEYTLAPIRYGWDRGPQSDRHKAHWDSWFLLHGKDRRAWILATRKLQIFIDLVEALRIMADRRMLHRDVKPAKVGVVGNCMVEACRGRLLDFGFACSLSEQASHEEHCSRTTGGSPRYMDRNVYAGEGYSQDSDVWSAGVILYSLFWGRMRKPLREAQGIDAVQDLVVSNETAIISGGSKFRLMKSNRFYAGWAALLERIEAPERISIEELHDRSLQELKKTKDEMRMTFGDVRFDLVDDSLGPGFGNKVQCDLAFEELKQDIQRRESSSQ